MDILLEGVEFNGNSFEFNFNVDKPGELISLTKNTVQFSKGGIKLFSAYKFNIKEKELNGYNLKGLTDSFKASLKANSELINSSDKEKFIKEGVERFNFEVGVDNFNFALYPRSSSGLVNVLAKELKSKSSSINLIDEAFIKNSLENIKIDYDSYLASAKTPQDKKKREYQLKSDFKRATKNGKFEIKKVFQNRKSLFSNFLIFNSEVDKKLFESIENGKVLIIDDIYTSGTTIVEMFNLLKQYAPKEINGFVLIK